MSDPQETLYSSCHKLKGINFDSPGTHSFASGSTQLLEDLQSVIGAMDPIKRSLEAYISSTTFTNPKLVSQLRQNSNISQSLLALEHQRQQIYDTLNGARSSPSRYGEEIPLDASKISEWCIARVEAWGASVGLQAFIEHDLQLKMTNVTLAGQVLVIDIVFSLGDRLEVSSVKLSYAIQSQHSTSYAAELLDDLLKRALTDFIHELQGSGNPREATELGVAVVNHLKYLAMLDGLASKPDAEGGGSKWFTDTDALTSMTDELAKLESGTVASGLSSKYAPLDIFLMRSHAVPLPYLSWPSLSFLVHISPRAYLSLRKMNTTSGGPFDISMSTIRSYLTSQPRPPGAYIATLKLVPHNSPIVHHGRLPFASRPMLPPAFSSSDHQFPQIDGHIWVLDFTENCGSQKGIIMSQMRMRDIECVIKGEVVAGMAATLPKHGESTWVDLLLNNAGGSSERYTSLYTSPSSLHPPLLLRLTTPPEFGFILQQVVVRNMRDVWGVLEVVKEQCWLNETLLGCKWAPESNQSPLPEQNQDEVPGATEYELQEILSGTIKPEHIPVNVHLPSPVFDMTAPGAYGIPRLTMVLPMMTQTSTYANMMDIDVVYDPNSAKGVQVDRGMVMLVGSLSEGEEICRRGGCFSLPGRAWLGMNT